MEIPNGWHERFKAGRIWASAIIKTRPGCSHCPAAALGRMPRLSRAFIQLQAWFSHVALTAVQRWSGAPGCVSWWWSDLSAPDTCFLQVLFKMCHTQPTGDGKDGFAAPLSLTCVFFWTACYQKDGNTWSESASFNGPFLQPKNCLRWKGPSKVI